MLSATTTVIDIYRRSFVKKKTDRHYLNASKFFTVLWGAIALFFAATAGLFENLIQAVNIIGSLFYGPILGIFMVAFFMKGIGARAVFIAALIAEALILALYWANGQGYWLLLSDTWHQLKIAYLWFNPIGCLLVMGIA